MADNEPQKPKRPSKSEWKEDPQRDLEEGIFNEAVQGRGGGMWAGTALGLTYGLVAGAVIGLVPSVVTAVANSALPVISTGAIAASMAVMGGIGIVQGRSGGAENGSAAGASVASTRVMLHEIRKQFDGLRKDSGITQSNARDEQPPSEEMATGNRSRYIKWTTLIAGAALGAVVGLVLGSLGIGGPVEGIFAKMGFAGMETLGASLIGASSGAFFGMNVPLITGKLHMVARSVINGRIFERDNSPAPALEQERAVESPEVAEPATGKPGQHFQHLVASQRETHISLQIPH